MGANVPGKKREFLLYLGGMPAWHKACVEALEGWKGLMLGVCKESGFEEANRWVSLRIFRVAHLVMTGERSGGRKG